MSHRPRPSIDPDLLDTELQDSVRAEMEFHLDMRTEELVDAGVPPARARRLAEQAFGDRSRTEVATVRYARRIRRRRKREAGMGELMQDLRQAARALIRRPGFSITVALTLALGIGGTTAMFAVVDGVLLEPLPFPEPDRLVRLWETTPSRPFRSLSPANFLDVRAGVDAIQDLTAYEDEARNLIGSGEPERLTVASVSSNFFQTLGVAAEAGRTFDPVPALPGEARSVVLSHGLWVRRFAADPDRIGQTIRLDDETVTILGVMPADFDVPVGTALWIKAPLDVPASGPLALAGRDHTAERAAWYFAGVGRLSADATLEQAQAQLDAVAARIRDLDPESNAETSFRLIPLHAETVREARTTVWMLFGAVGFVLLIACANVANLALARSVEREQEMAVRAALGAGRSRLLRHLLTENGLLGAIGGAAGLGLALLLLNLLRAAPGLPRAAQIQASPAVLLFALVLTAVSTALFGSLPALVSSIRRPGGGLGSRGGTASPDRARIRHALVVAEVGLAVVLVLGASLTLQSLWHMSRVDLGVETDQLLVLRFSLPGARGMEAAEWQGAYRRALENVAALPGIEAAGVSSADPLTSGWSAGLRVLGRTYDSNNPVDAGWSAITPGYLDALGPRVVAGRSFDTRDGPDGLPVAIVNETFANRVFPGEDPLGKQINTGLDGPGRYVTVVGVMEDVRNRGPVLPVQPAYVRPLAQPGAFGGDRVTLAVRSGLAPGTLVPRIQQAVWEVEPDAPFYRIETGLDLGRTYGTDVRFVLVVLGAFALVALVLGGVGIYGVAANSARRRTREIGIRIALGAARRQASGLIVREGLLLALLGTALGALAALGLMRLLSSVLFGVRPADPATYAAVITILLSVSLLATWAPARRAGRTDPMSAMRSE